jgi:nucleoside-diphosphate-sugar epimerase
LDVTRIQSLVAGMVGVKTVFHCAAVVPFNMGRRFDAAELQRVNVVGTESVIAAAKAAGVQQLIYISSTGAVFCGHPISGLDEDSTPTPSSLSSLNDAYSASKAAAERAVLQGEQS